MQLKSLLVSTLLIAAGSLALASPVAADNADHEAEAPDFVAHLHPMNTGITGMQTKGTARFAIENGQLTITVDAKNLPPGIMHLQHFHGFTNPGEAHCPTVAADTNDDGVVDLIETHPVSGTTMVPFTTEPASMTVVTDTYPTASAEGTYHYRETVPLDALRQAFAKAFGGQELDFDRRVVYIHGVLPESDLPESVASLGKIPAHVTLPIACGEIEPVGD